MQSYKPYKCTLNCGQLTRSNGLMINLHLTEMQTCWFQNIRFMSSWPSWLIWWSCSSMMLTTSLWTSSSWRWHVFASTSLMIWSSSFFILLCRPKSWRLLLSIFDFLAGVAKYLQLVNLVAPICWVSRHMHEFVPETGCKAWHIYILGMGRMAITARLFLYWPHLLHTFFPLGTSMLHLALLTVLPWG